MSIYAEVRKKCLPYLINDMSIKKVATYLFIFLLCAVDIALTALYEEPILHSVTILYCIWLFTKPVSLTFFFALLCIGLESFLYHGKFGTSLIILLPITALSFHFRKNFNIPKLGPLLGFTCYLLFYWFVLEPFFLGIPSIQRYTLAKIGANLLVMIPFLLKF